MSSEGLFIHKVDKHLQERTIPYCQKFAQITFFFTFSCLIFVLNLYSKLAQKGKKLLEVAISAKSCSKVAEHNLEMPSWN